MLDHQPRSTRALWAALAFVVFADLIAVGYGDLTSAAEAAQRPQLSPHTELADLQGPAFGKALETNAYFQKMKMLDAAASRQRAIIYVTALVKNQQALAKNREAAKQHRWAARKNVAVAVVPVQHASVSVSGSIASVMACIRRHESGNYADRTYGYNGASGAYQMIRSTWVSLSGMAGHPGYATAADAPPSVQDDVVAWALTHGEAGNWSMKFGDDPCTSGLPGGG